MNNKDWFFPANVGEVVTKYQLDYKPPGYYYKAYSDGSEVILYYYYAEGDFDNGSQHKEVLFSRKLHSYAFRFANNPGVLDSLRQNLEATYHKELVLTESHEYEKTSIGSGKPIPRWGLLPVNDELTIGVAHGEKKIVVRYMYNLRPGLMEEYMKRFTE